MRIELQEINCIIMSRKELNFSWIYPYKNYLELEREECICVNQYFKVYFEVQTFRFRKQMNSIEIQTRVNKKHKH